MIINPSSVLNRKLWLNYKNNKDDYALRWHDGHKRRSHVTVKESSFKKCFFREILNSILFLSILMFSFLNSIQVLGKFTRGCLDKEASLVKGMVRSSLLRRIWWISVLLSSLVVHTLLKEMGRKPWEKCCINCKLKNSINLGKGKIHEALKRGSVWALYLALLIILIAFFCAVNKPLISFCEEQLQIGTQ